MTGTNTGFVRRDLSRKYNWWHDWPNNDWAEKMVARGKLRNFYYLEAVSSTARTHPGNRRKKCRNSCTHLSPAHACPIESGWLLLLVDCLHNMEFLWQFDRFANVRFVCQQTIAIKLIVYPSNKLRWECPYRKHVFSQRIPGAWQSHAPRAAFATGLRLITRVVLGRQQTSKRK